MNITDHLFCAKLWLYGVMESEMIYDRLVVRIHDSALSQHLQLDVELKLNRLKATIFST